MYPTTNKLLFSFTLCSGLVFTNDNIYSMLPDSDTSEAKSSCAQTTQRPTIQQCLDGLKFVNAIKELEKFSDKLASTTLDYTERVKLRSAIGDAYSEIALLIRHGIYLDMQDDQGNTPLMVAVMAKDFRLVKYLVEARASRTIVNRKNQTAYDLAVLNENHCIAEYLEAADRGISYEQLLDERLLELVRQPNQDLADSGDEFEFIFR
jgi:ankyrin repeat protein